MDTIMLITSKSFDMMSPRFICGDNEKLGLQVLELICEHEYRGEAKETPLVARCNDETFLAGYRYTYDNGKTDEVILRRYEV